MDLGCILQSESIRKLVTGILTCHLCGGILPSVTVRTSTTSAGVPTSAPAAPAIRPYPAQVNMDGTQPFAPTLIKTSMEPEYSGLPSGGVFIFCKRVLAISKGIEATEVNRPDIQLAQACNAHARGRIGGLTQ
ncbi:hypothetical protein GQX74_004390 [Glossina fuscipes]|uniref:Uncharacterized protein n=1 Tax=Glossina palpalis gambiensis TaxID=67801 RepID=A0A1B0AZ11_9MUSC|nr:hypothetical protein GQX74_004390 [Glossina fuscipes]